MDDATAKIVAAIFVFMVLFGIPVYNFFASRAKEKKEQDNVFHARINELMKQVAKQEGHKEGRKEAFAEMALFLQLAKMAAKT